MQIYEKINTIIKQKNITKRDFSNTLRNLHPILRSTGEPPSEQTVYKYLSGDINIPIELLSYIAEVLNIAEQELFETDFNTKVKLYKYINRGLTKQQQQFLFSIYKNCNLVCNTNYKIPNELSNVTFHHVQQIDHLLSLLEYMPKPMLEAIINRLEQIKMIAQKEL